MCLNYKDWALSTNGVPFSLIFQMQNRRKICAGTDTEPVCRELK